MRQSFLNHHVYHFDEHDGPFEDHWWQGRGWYWADEVFQLNGPYDTEQLAIGAYCRYVETLFVGAV